MLVGEGRVPFRDARVFGIIDSTKFKGLIPRRVTRSDSARPAQAADTRAAAAAQVRHLDNNRDPIAGADDRPGRIKRTRHWVLVGLRRSGAPLSRQGRHFTCLNAYPITNLKAKYAGAL